jgi:hypothetical protein
MHSYVDSYKRVLSFLTPKKVLEWGPGINTEMALDAGAFVFSIEQSIKYLPEIQSNKWFFRILPVKDSQYVEHPYGDADWDLYFIDSRRRQECISLAEKEGKHGSVVCLHDAQRDRYHKNLRTFSYVRFLHKGFCVASHDQKILSIK